MGRFTSILRWGLSGLLLCCAMAVQAQRIYLVASEGTPSFQAAIDAFAQELARAGVARQDWQQLALSDVARLDSLADDGKLVVTWGADAFRLVQGRSPRAAVLAALIPRIGFERVLAQIGRKPGPGIVALYLDQPFARQLDLLRMALPEARDLGVIWGPESISQQPLLLASAKSHGFALRESTLVTGGSLVNALRAATNEADVLLAVPDGHVYNPATATDILLTTYRARIPVFVFSPSYVKAGAMLSLHTAPEQVGIQAAAMAHTFLQTGALPASQYPADFTITVNEYVARSLGLALDARRLTSQLHQQEKRP